MLLSAWDAIAAAAAADDDDAVLYAGCFLLGHKQRESCLSIRATLGGACIFLIDRLLAKWAPSAQRERETRKTTLICGSSAHD